MTSIVTTLGHRARALTQTGVGQKALLGASGAVWLGFLLLHLYSNLHVFLGREAMNAYYEQLEAGPAQLWGVRIVLILAFATHVATAVTISRQSLSARRSRYARFTPVVTGYAARTMRWTGPIVLAYVVYHLLHLTLGMAMPAGLVRDPHDFYGNVVRSFEVPAVAAAYVVASLALGVHLWHGGASVLQSLGLGDPRTQRAPRLAVSVLTALMVLGFVAMPLAVQLGWLAP